VIRARYLNGRASIAGPWSSNQSVSIPDLSSISGFRVSLKRCGGTCLAVGGCTITPSCQDLVSGTIYLYTANFQLDSSNMARCNLTGTQLCCDYNYYYASSSYSSNTPKTSCASLSPSGSFTMQYEETSEVILDSGSIGNSPTKKTAWSATLSASYVSGAQAYQLQCFPGAPTDGAAQGPTSQSRTPTAGAASAVAMAPWALLALIATLMIVA
jgi:hypothetical protein